MHLFAQRQKMANKHFTLDLGNMRANGVLALAASSDWIEPRTTMDEKQMGPVPAQEPDTWEGRRTLCSIG
jgi:hypothetical protein